MEMDFNISAQTLSSALKAFAEETGLQMLYSSDAIKGIRSSRVNGRYQPKDALNILNFLEKHYEKYYGKPGNERVFRLGGINTQTMVTETTCR